MRPPTMKFKDIFDTNTEIWSWSMPIGLIMAILIVIGQSDKPEGQLRVTGLIFGEILLVEFSHRMIRWLFLKGRAHASR